MCNLKLPQYSKDTDYNELSCIHQDYLKALRVTRWYINHHPNMVTEQHIALLQELRIHVAKIETIMASKLNSIKDTVSAKLAKPRVNV